jgi:phosphoribosyl-ATP pyrophosphohydrolase
MTIYELEKKIAERAREQSSGSYTVRLLNEGVEKCAKKMGEEAVEFALAATSGERKRILSEAADLLFHTLVTFRSCGIFLAEVEEVLAERNAQRSTDPKANYRGT